MQCSLVNVVRNLVIEFVADISHRFRAANARLWHMTIAENKLALYGYRVKWEYLIQMTDSYNYERAR